MTANQCNRPNLPDPQIYESFSVCSLRSDSQLGVNTLRNAITKCCTTSVKQYQCWNYCGVEESQFSTWLDCIHEATNSTWGAACQRADQSPVLTATGPYPSSYTQPAPPLGYTPPPTYSTSTTSKAPLISRASWSIATNATATLLSPTGDSNGNRSTPVGLASPTTIIQGGSPKALVLSMGGMICALLVLSTLIL
ncbi:hypothetical protein CJF32_00009072 [Rutstroemia sp. NJR-2017a WRK4]|nr:hypothetical protein CJF32_00009072 [Rutstroemia sp. NJR-2017a WRK4]